MLDKIISRYRDSLNSNLENIRSVEFVNKEIEEGIRSVLTMSSENIIDAWVNKRKFCRTSFVMKAFGKFYPSEHILLSLSVDSIVNILDDLYDEDLDEKQKTLFIFELTRNLSLLSLEKADKFNLCLGNYFNKLITLAVAENSIEKNLPEISSNQILFDTSVDLLSLRAMDIDFYCEVALKAYDAKTLVKENILELCRVFRILNILKKDILDIEHDLKLGKKGIINEIVFIQKKMTLNDFINGIVKKIFSVYDKPLKNIPKNDYVISNFLTMIENERNEIVLSLIKYKTE